MNPVQNPFAPGAGTQPKELAARGPLRSSLIAKGMIYSSSHGDNGFTGLYSMVFSSVNSRNPECQAAMAPQRLSKIDRKYTI
jgi:hypothetical protein